jgi:SAP domain
MLYARSDLQSEGPAPGCAENHLRPLDPRTGKPVVLWALDCPAHEAHLKGSRRGIVKSPISKSATGPLTYGIIDSSPNWGSTPDTVPLTPDEERTDATRRERGRTQIEMLQALAAMRATGVAVPAEAMWLLEKELPPGVLRGTVICANSHDVPAGSAFCPSCGVSMAVKAAIGSGEDEPSQPAADLGRLHPQTLKKLCRERGLDDAGSKDDLIQRLAA